MKKLIHYVAGIILASMPLAACTDRAGTQEAAEAYGFEDIHVTGHAFVGCGKDDDTRTKFTARNSRGELIEGVACSNWSPFGKATTIRVVGKVR